MNLPALVAERERAAAIRAFSALSYVVLAGGLITIAVAVHMVVVSYSSLPYSDAWTEINAAVRGVNLLSPQWLWQQHNEHRIVVPKLFLAADLSLFRCRQIFPLVSILLIQLAHLGVLSWAVRRFGGWTGSTWRLATGVMAFCLFCPSQWENFVWSFQTCFVLPGLFATLSFAGLLLYSTGQEKWSWLAMSVAAALGAQYSLASGNLVWPLLIAGALWLRIGWRGVSAYALIGGISTFFFFHHYVLTYVPGRLSAGVRSPAKLCLFLLAYIGGAWSNDPVRAAIGGACGLGITVLLVCYLRNVTLSRPLFALLILTLAFCVGAALLTAVARLHMGLEQALASRYQTPVLLFWGELALLLLLAARGKTWPPRLLAVIALCVLVVFVRGAYQAVYPIRQARWHGFQVNAAGAAMLSGVDDPYQFYLAAVDSTHMMQDAAYLRQRRLSVFASSIYGQLHQPLAAGFGLIPSGRCTGALQSVSALPASHGANALRISGWAWYLEEKTPASYIVAVADGEVVGFGATGDWRPTIRAANRYMNTSFIGFTAYAQSPQPSTPITVYGVLNAVRRQACPIATIQP